MKLRSLLEPLTSLQITLFYFRGRFLILFLDKLIVSMRNYLVFKLLCTNALTRKRLDDASFGPFQKPLPMPLGLSGVQQLGL